MLEETFRITTKKLAAEERVGDKDIIYIASPPLLCGREEIGREGRVAGLRRGRGGGAGGQGRRVDWGAEIFQTAFLPKW